MSLHLTPDQLAALPAWEDTGRGRADALASEIAVAALDILAPIAAAIIHESAVCLRPHRPSPSDHDMLGLARRIDRLAPILDVLMAHTITASIDDAGTPDSVGTVGLCVLHPVIDTAVRRLGIPALPPRSMRIAAMTHTQRLDDRIDRTVETITERGSEHRPPWTGVHPLSDHARAGRAIDLEQARTLAMTAVADLRLPAVTEP